MIHVGYETDCPQGWDERDYADEDVVWETEGTVRTLGEALKLLTNAHWI